MSILLSTIITVLVAGITGSLAAYINSLHLRRSTKAEILIKTAGLFSDLVGTAYGYGEYTDPQREVLDRIIKEYTPSQIS